MVEYIKGRATADNDVDRIRGGGDDGEGCKKSMIPIMRAIRSGRSSEVADLA
jgi:hypothetical protein